MLNPLAATTAGLTAGAATQRSQFNRQDFLKLLTTEMSHQNPLDPVSSKDFVSQLADLQMLETNASLEDTLSNLLKFQQVGAASSLLGKTVRAVSDQGAPVTGRVDRILVDGAKVQLVVDGQVMPLASVKEIVSEPVSQSQ